MTAAVTFNRYWRVKLAAGAPWSPLRIWTGYPVDPVTSETLTERPCLWRACLNGTDVDISEVVIEFDGQSGDPVVKGEQVDAAEYQYLLERHIWARRYDPTDIAANPRKKIDLHALPPLF